MSGPARSAAVLPVEQLADPARVSDAYRAHIERTGLSRATVLSYGNKVASFATWLADTDHHLPVDTFTDPLSRDHATRDYRAYLLAERRLAPKTVDAHLSALDNLWEWAGLGRAKVNRVGGHDASAGFGEHLTRTQARDVLRQAERRGPRDLALVGLMMFAGLRVAEVHGVNMDDWWVSARGGMVEVRHGKGSKFRQVGLNPQLRTMLTDWQTARRSVVGADTEPALFLSTRGGRLAIRTINHTVGQVGQAAGVTLHPHLLRHTCARNLLEEGVPIVDVQMALGHSSVRTTQGYTRPSREQAAAAMNRVAIDF